MNDELKSCMLCPRECGADRLSGETGYCRCGVAVKAARAAPHLWEEPCISGTKGSGAVFFSGCTLGCVFCQNRTLSHKNEGIEISEQRLCEIFLELQSAGVHNVNLVTPTQWIPQIKDALIYAWEKDFYLPVVYNTGGYEKSETIASLRGFISIYLPDFKYMDNLTAERFSGVKNYSYHSKKALNEMVEQRGGAVFDSDGIMRRGVIVRHLVLPGHTDDSMRVIEYLHTEYGDEIYISIMNQYTPQPGMTGELARCVTAEEYKSVIDFAVSAGVKNGYIQGGETAKESFIPKWDGTGMEKNRYNLIIMK